MPVHAGADHGTLSAQCPKGGLYEVDMRLRPSGNQGPVATSWASFTNYQQNEAWVWEHLALTRAHVVAGDAGLAEDIESFRAEFLSHPRDQAKVLREVAEMRARLAAAKAPAGIWDAKNGPGRLMDIELMAETGALLAGLAQRDVSSGLDGAVAAGLLDVAQAQSLKECYDLCWSVQCAARLLSGKVIEADKIGEGGTAFLCRATGFEQVEAATGRIAGQLHDRSRSDRQRDQRGRRWRAVTDPNDHKGLILEAYRIEGITLPECRSIFLDWALSLPGRSRPKYRR